MSDETIDYRAAARKKFAALTPLFAGCNNYWRLGTSFDTAIDYLQLDDRGLEAFCRTALERFEATQGAWYDDFGWWGISMLRASQLKIPGELAAKFKAHSKACWSHMDQAATTVWNPQTQAQYPEFGPLVAGGVWNACWSGADGCRLGGDPQGQLAGIQNTVTNGLYWVLASRWYLASKNQDFRDKAERQARFLFQWFTQTPADDSLWMKVAGPFPSGLVRERVSKFAPYKGTQLRQAYFDHRVVWSGDQGLVLGGLVDRLAMLAPGGLDYESTLAKAREVVYGVYDRLVDKRTRLLQPWLPTPVTCHNAPGDDWEDYSTGPSVFWRYLLYAWNNNAQLKEMLSTQGFRDVLRANAEQAARNPDNPSPPCTVTADENACCYPMLALSNDLAALTAAAVMLG